MLALKWLLLENLRVPRHANKIDLEKDSKKRRFAEEAARNISMAISLENFGCEGGIWPQYVFCPNIEVFELIWNYIS
jgi:hypothetical protein